MGKNLRSNFAVLLFVACVHASLILFCFTAPTYIACKPVCVPFGLTCCFLLQNLLYVFLKVPEVIEDSGDALNLLWVATQPFLRDGLAGPVAPSISRSVVELVHVFLTKGGPTAGDALVSSGAVAPIVHVSLLLILY